MTQREFAKPIMIERARDLRADATIFERRIWQHIRNKKLGVRFRRQHPVAGYILDFACEERKLGIELDGSQHNEARGTAYDAKRTAALEKSGWRILRFWNNEVMDNLEGVYLAIEEALTRKT